MTLSLVYARKQPPRVYPQPWHRVMPHLLAEAKSILTYQSVRVRQKHRKTLAPQTHSQRGPLSSEALSMGESIHSALEHSKDWYSQTPTKKKKKKWWRLKSQEGVCVPSLLQSVLHCSHQGKLKISMQGGTPFVYAQLSSSRMELRGLDFWLHSYQLSAIFSWPGFGSLHSRDS